MIDLKVIKLKDLAKITRAELLTEQAIRSLLQIPDGDTIAPVMVVEGDNFNRATNVLLNGTDLEFWLASPTKLYATVPLELVNRSLDSLFVVTDKDSFTNTSLFSYKFGPTPTLMTGGDKVVTQFLKVLFTTPGTDMFDTGLGGGMQGFPGSVSASPQLLLVQISMMILRVVDQIRTRQANLATPADEKLSNVDILALDFAKNDPSSVEMSLRVSTLAGAAQGLTMTMGIQGLLDTITNGTQ